jgi:hypothetical protein
MISSPEDFDLAEVVAALRVLQLSGRAASVLLSLPSSLSWRSFILYKNGEKR